MKGNKPDYHNAMDYNKAKEYFDELVQELRLLHNDEMVQTGEFGAYMNVKIENDGPVTINLDY